MSCILKKRLEEYGLPGDTFLDILNNSNALIAGSFPLSIFLEQKNLTSFVARDIDIFVHKDQGYESLLTFLKIYCYKISEPLIKNGYPDVHNIYVADYNKHRIQVIVTKTTPKQNVLNFDLTCCQVYIDPEFKKIIHLDEENVLKMRTSYTTMDIIFQHSTGTRFEKYFRRGFKFYYNDIDITEKLGRGPSYEKIVKVHREMDSQEIIDEKELEKTIKEVFTKIINEKNPDESKLEKMIRQKLTKMIEIFD